VRWVINILEKFLFFIQLPLCLLILGCVSHPKDYALRSRDVEPLYLKGEKIVVVAHPHCHFSRTALSEMDQETKNYINKQGLILTEVRDSHAASDFEAIREWNNQHHELIHVPVKEGEAFTQLDFKSTPQFYFFSNGNLVAHFVGWAPDGSYKARLKKSINKLKKTAN